MTFSVVVPTYNRLPFLREALEGVWQQTHPVDEIIVVDDGSTDGTEAAIRALPQPVRYVRQQNAGPAAARNRGFREARCDWIALLDSDDLWLPDKIAAQRAFLEKNPCVEFLFAHMALSYPTSDEDEPEIINRDVYAYCRDHAEDLRELVTSLFVVNPIPTSSVVFARAAMERVGFIREDLRCSEDFDWWLRWSLKARCGFLDQMVVRRRIHSGNIIGDRLLMLESTRQVLRDLVPRSASLRPAQRNSLQAAIHRKTYALACEYYRRKDYARAVDLLRQTNPRQLGGKIVALKWLAKYASASAARLLRV